MHNKASTKYTGGFLMKKSLFEDVLYELSISTGEVEQLREFDLSNIIYIRNITKDDEEILRDIHMEIAGKIDVKHTLALADYTRRAYESSVKNVGVVSMIQDVVKNTVNAVTVVRYFITDIIKYMTNKLWDALPKTIKDSVKTIYSTVFDSIVSKLYKLLDPLNNKIVIIAGVRIKLTELLKDMFFIVIAGMIIRYIFFQSPSSVETGLAESTALNIIAPLGLVSEALIMLAEGNISDKDVPARPIPKNPYGKEEPKSIFERIVAFFASIYTSFKKEVVNVFGKLACLLIVIPLLVLLIFVSEHFIEKLPDGRVKTVLLDSVTSIKRIMRISTDETLKWSKENA
jgi:hypothetical protein